MENVEEILKKQREQVGKRLKELRGDTSQKDVSTLLGIGQSAYSAKERGEDSLTPEQIQMIMNHYNVSYYWLMTGFEQQALPNALSEKDCYKLLYERELEVSKFLKEQLEVRNGEMAALLAVVKNLPNNG